MVGPGRRFVPFPAWSACAAASGPATGLSLRSPGRTTDLFPEPRAFLVPAAPALSFLIARWETSWPPGRPVCGPLPARRCHLTAGKDPAVSRPPPEAASPPGHRTGRQPMNPISITVTGRLGDDPRTFSTRDGTHGVELRLALDLPARGTGEGITRWVKVTAFGRLATRTAESVRKGDRVTVLADDLMAEAWTATGSGEPRARVTLRAREIAASMAFDSLRTGYAARKAARLAAANGEPSDLP